MRHHGYAAGRRLFLLLSLCFVSACATTRTPVPVVVTPSYPDYPFPAVPDGLAGPGITAEHRAAWQFLQAGDVKVAERRFAALLTAVPGFYPAQAGLGFASLARRDHRAAAGQFDRALEAAPAYVPALVGRGEALLALAREDDALHDFETALAADPSLADVRRRVEVLTFKRVEAAVSSARAAAAGGRWREAEADYERAIALSPESPFLYRELAGVKQRVGDLSGALAQARRAAELDPSDVRALVLEGDLLEHVGDLEGAERAYVRAQTLDSAVDLASRLESVRARIRLARLPPEYRAIRESAELTRGELAALIGVRLDALVQNSRPRNPVVVTDTRGQWATPWILSVVRAGIMEAYANHTFQPHAGVRRGELAQVVSRLLNVIAVVDPARARAWRTARQTFTDLNPGHLIYPAASLAVAAGVLPVLDGNTFQLARPVSGAEAIAAIERLEGFVGQKP